MTKTQVTLDAKISKNKPLDRSRYIGFYLTLLILSTVGTAFSFVGLLGIIDTIKQFEVSPLYSVFSLINLLVVVPVAIWALVLLWMKRPLGITLKLSTYALSIVCAVGLLLSAAPVIKSVAQEAQTEIAKSSSQQMSASFVEGITSFTIYIGLSLAIIISLVFSLLWYSAWKKQVESDTE